MSVEQKPPPEPADTQVGRKAIELGFVTELQLEEVLQELTVSGVKEPPSLGSVLVSKGIISKQQLGVIGDLAAATAPNRVGKYHILRELGRGGMGVVYEAHDPELGRRLAVKMLLLNSDLSPGDLVQEEERFIREARTCANLPKHPQIVGVYEAGVADGQRFIAMEFIEGRQFSEWRKKGVSLRHQVAVLRDVALAVDHAHQHGVIHRDLKPANILVDANNRPHVTDFGLAKRTRRDGSHSSTESGVVLGTPAYMSPEQAQGRADVGLAADIWALGLMLYEILAQRRPFDAKTPMELITKTVHDKILPPSSVRGGVSSVLESVCMKALSKNPQARQASAKAFADELTRWVKSEKTGIRVRPQSPVKAWLIGGALALLAIAGVAALALQSPPAEELARDRARDFVAQGQRLLDQGKYSDALVKFGQALGEEPGNRPAVAGKKEAEEKMLASAKPAGPTAPVAPAPPPEDPSRKAREAAAKQRELISKQLAELDTAVGSMRDAESFGAARDFLTQALKRLEDAEWKGAVASRLEELKKAVDGLLGKLKDETAELKRKGDAAAVKAAQARVERWKWPGAAIELDEALARVVPPPDPAPVPPPTPAPLPPPAPTPPPADASAMLLELAPLPHRANAVNSIAFSPDGKSVLVSDYDKRVELWDVPARELRKQLSEGEPSVSTAYSPDGRWLAAGFFDGRVKLWDSAKLQLRVLTGHHAQTLGLTFTPDSKLLVSASTEGSARLWEVLSGSPKGVLEGHPKGALSATVSPNGRLLAVGSGEQLVKLWELPSGRESRRLEIGSDNSSIATVFLPDGKSVASGGISGRVCLLDVDSGRARVLGAHLKEVRGIAVSPDGRWMASSAQDGIKLWEVSTGQLRATIADANGFFGVAFSRKGDLLAAGSGDFSVRVWDAAPLSRQKPAPK